jgi:hypothetical protein
MHVHGLSFLCTIVGSFPEKDFVRGKNSQYLKYRTLEEKKLLGNCCYINQKTCHHQLTLKTTIAELYTTYMDCISHVPQSVHFLKRILLEATTDNFSNLGPF